MKTLVHKAGSRGGGDHGWLQTRHSFSFADWHDPQRMGFGALRVLNDDVVAAGKGFGMHPHQDFEIITIVMSGVVTHEDSIGTHAEVKAGEVQVMSAGTGVVHSERNDSAEELRLFQIWIAPNTRGVPPRYDQKKFDDAGQKDTLQLLVSGTGENGSLMIHQDARIYRLDMSGDKEIKYPVQPGHGVYAFVISGEVEVAGIGLESRDAVGVTEADSFVVKAKTPASVLCIEVPL